MDWDLTFKSSKNYQQENYTYWQNTEQKQKKKITIPRLMILMVLMKRILMTHNNKNNYIISREVSK